MLILFSGALFLFGICLLYLAALSFALLVVLKLLMWSLQAILWIVGMVADPQSEPLITINSVDVEEYEEPDEAHFARAQRAKDVTPRMRRIGPVDSR